MYLTIIFLCNSCSTYNRSLAANNETSTIYFLAYGNEPSWSLKTEGENNVVFKTLDDLELNLIFDWQPTAPNNAEKYELTLSNGSNSLVIEFKSETCSDQMKSGKLEYKVTIKYQDFSSGTFREYLGCGTYNQ